MVNAIEMLNNASKGKYAIPQFNINNLEWTKYILEECNELKSPVILGVSEGAAKYMGGFFVVSNMVLGLIKDLGIKIPVALHLDHGSSFLSCKNAIDAGFTSVMIDASNQSIEDNIKITKEVVEYAKIKNVSVEAEIGKIGGTEDDITTTESLAGLDDCILLYNKTNVNFIAPAIGSVHGMHKGPLNLNLNILIEIKKSIDIPLVLHGGTGIPENKIIQCIKNGISKININTELQLEWSKAVRKYLKDNVDVYDPRKIIASGENALKETVKRKVILLNSGNRI